MRSIAWDTLIDKIRGGWIGKSLGGTVGRFEGTRRITGFDIMELLPPKMLPNDDLDIQLIWLDVLLEKGIHFTSDDLMAAWVAEYDYNFGEYGYARRNWARGIRPPLSGSHGNRYYLTGMGCPIRSEVWGMIAPGDPALAAAYAHKDGVLDHAGESVWAEQMLSAMEAEAFFEADLRRLLEKGLEYAPKGSHLRRCVRDAIGLHGQGLPWQAAWERLARSHSHPDCTYSPFNLGIIALALLYGRGDMDATLSIAVNAGWDVDCTCSTVAAILGIVSGAGGLHDKWRKAIGDEVVTLARPVHPMGSIGLITGYTARAAATLFSQGLLGCSIQGISAGLQLLPTGRPAVSLAVEYPQGPQADAGQPVQVLLRAHNSTGQAIAGRIEVSGPQGSLLPAPQAVAIPAGGSAALPVTVAIPDGGAVRDANLFAVRFDGNERAGTTFGVCGRPPARVLGPFYDTYEQWCAVEGGGHMLETKGYRCLTPVFGEEWGNYRVDIGKPYIPEDFCDTAAVRAAFSTGEAARVGEDTYRIADVFGMQGPCVAYWYQELICDCEQDVQFFIGSTDPASLWLNGGLVFSQKGCRYYYCNNDVVTVRLRLGANPIVLKTVRAGADNTLTLCVRHVPHLGGYDSCAFVEGLSWAVL